MFCLWPPRGENTVVCWGEASSRPFGYRQWSLHQSNHYSLSVVWAEGVRLGFDQGIASASYDDLIMLLNVTLWPVTFHPASLVFWTHLEDDLNVKKWVFSVPCGRMEAKYKFLFEYQMDSSLPLKNVSRQQLVINIERCSKSMVSYSREKGNSRNTRGYAPNGSEDESCRQFLS